MPISRHARMMRTAISPRLAIRTFFTNTQLYSAHARLKPRATTGPDGTLSNGGRGGGRTAVVGGLLVAVSQLEEHRLAPRAAEELQPRRERVAAGESHRHGDRGEACR